MTRKIARVKEQEWKIDAWKKKRLRRKRAEIRKKMPVKQVTIRFIYCDNTQTIDTETEEPYLVYDIYEELLRCSTMTLFRNFLVAA